MAQKPKLNQGGSFPIFSIPSLISISFDSNIPQLVPLRPLPPNSLPRLEGHPLGPPNTRKNSTGQILRPSLQQPNSTRTNHNLFVVSLFEDRPLLVDITNPIPIKHRITTTPLTEADISKSESKQATTAAIFSVQGTHIITGTSKGYLNILETSTRRIIHSTKLSSGLISLLRIDTSGRHLLVNSTTRIIRVVSLPDLSRLFPSSIPTDAIPEDAPAESLAENITLPTLHKFQDLVNRLRWNDSAFLPTPPPPWTKTQSSPPPPT